jgi:hypothetical protein
MTDVVFFMVVLSFMVVVVPPSLGNRSLPSHLASIRVFDVERAYHVGSRLDLGSTTPGRRTRCHLMALCAWRVDGIDVASLGGLAVA